MRKPARYSGICLEGPRTDPTEWLDDDDGSGDRHLYPSAGDGVLNAMRGAPAAELATRRGFAVVCVRVESRWGRPEKKQPARCERTRPWGPQ